MTKYESHTKSHKRRIWVSQWIQKRKEKGLHHNLFLELLLEDPNRFRRFDIFLLIIECNLQLEQL